MRFDAFLNNLVADIAILLVLLIAGLLFSRKDILSPAVLTAFIWLTALVCFALLPHPLPPLNKQVLLGIGLWASGLSFGALLTQSFRYSTHTMQMDVRIREIFFWLSLVCLPFLLLFISQALSANVDESPAMRLRLAALGNGTTKGEPYLPFYYLLWLATYLLYLFENNRRYRIRAFIMGLLVFCFAIGTMSKFLILNLGVITMVALFYKKVIRFRHLAIGAGVLVAVLLVLHAIRQSRSLDGEYTSFLMEQYVLRNFVAFDTLQPYSSEHAGENVFRFFYAVTYRLGISSVEPIDPILPWIYKPVCTNTYTCLYPYFKDFGYWGIGLFAPALGALIGWIYKRHQQGDLFFSMLYAYLSTMLIYQFDGELFFTNMAGHIKFIILLALPFLFGGYKKAEV